ncbi:hypothetical protein KVT40_004667 [Elsinoe batatas]|uniref:Uncharacterized protein n=1 Tax=Elsinoe batatas TaxID=2601811 RepID=A0A8K0L026_9PEZI|nr:hypothetical protein KVT40_004667 [Elsinoe batatas]
MIARALTLLSTPIILLLSIPLTLFALLTTTLALLTLLLRVSIIYLELLLAVIQSFLLPSPPPTKPLSLRPSSPLLPTNQPLRHHARRRTSSSSSTTSLHTPSFGPGAPGQRLTKPPSLASLLGTTTPRDYESVGGWRLTSADSDEEALWTGINSRLELPALTVPSPGNLARDHHGAGGGRYHHRSLTGGSRRGSTRAGTVSGNGSPELVAQGAGGRRRRGKGSGAGSPEGYFSGQGVVGVGGGSGDGVEGARGLGMTSAEGGQQGRGTREGSRRGSVSLVKVRGE